MNEQLTKLRQELNDFESRKHGYILQRDQADDMIDEINFRIDEIHSKIEMIVKGEEIAV